MRSVAAFVASLVLLASPARPALASCAPPATVGENAARAESVVYGTVTSVSDGAATVRVDRVLKGSAAGTITVWLGPGRGGSAGTAVATSIDYTAAPGTDHVLYLIRGSDGQLETSACIGSHAGPPNSDETAHFAAAASPEASASGPVGAGLQSAGAGTSAVPQVEGSGVSAAPPPGPALLAGFGVVLLAVAALAVGLRRRFIARRAS